MNATLSPDTTLVDVLCQRLRACTSTSDGIEQPHVIIWTDPKGHWRSLIHDVVKAMPELLVYGEFDPDARIGPAIWLRCMIDRTLEHPPLPDDAVPVIYLPGIGRQDLRAGEHCSDALKPLVELMYRGVLWLQKGGHDWTATAFLTSASALGLDVSGDDQSTEALLRALPEFAIAPIGQFHGRRLEADDFDKLLSSDVVRDLLLWMNDAERTEERLGADGWAAFSSRCKEEFDFDPETDGETVGGERLGGGEGPWAQIWSRFEEAPQHYPKIPELLRRSKPGLLTLDRSRWPDFNDDAEKEVRQAFAGLGELKHAEACATVLALEAEHAVRRSWIWCRLGLSSMAQTLAPLAVLAKHAQSAIGGQSPDEIARTYVERGWQADQASWQAVALAPAKDEGAVRGVVQHLLKTWLHDSARAFQGAVARSPLPNHDDADVVSVPKHGCLLFADGLRYDLGESLRDRLESRGCRVRLEHRWAALPTVTATAKPAVTPVARDITGGVLPADFTPVIASTKKPANAAAIRSAIEASGYQVLTGGMGDWPESDDSRGWIEEGKIDTRGHQLQAELARHLDAEIDRLAGRIIELLDAGWTSVRVVTDHGWLLLPKGLPRVSFPKHLTASKWARCATIAGDSRVGFATAPWHWNTTQHFATAPGIACFTAPNYYTHGGLSVQECLIPDLTVERSRPASVCATILGVTWKRLRCSVATEGGSGQIQADLRLNTATGISVAASPKPLEEDGPTSLLLEEDEYESADLVVVLLASDGTVLAQHKTKVGSDS